jgi:hypothetical protein
MAPRTVAEMTPDEFAEAMARAQGATGRSNFRSSNTGSSGKSGADQGFSLFDAALVGSAGKLGVATVAVEHLGRTIGENEKMWQDATNIGINYNNDIIGLRASIGQTRLGYEDFFKALQVGRDGMKLNITTLGSDMTTATKNFAKLSSDFTTLGFGEQLNKLGYSTEEYNEVLALSISGQRALNIEGKDPAAQAARAAALESAANLATEMDKISKLTGISREAQRQKMQEDLMDGRYQAQIALMTANGAKDVQNQFAQLQNTFAGSGKATQDFVKNMLEGGQLTEKSITFLSATGDAGREVEASTKNLKEALRSNDQERIKEAQARASDANLRLQEYVMRKNNLDMVSSYDSKQNEVLGGIIVASGRQRNATESLATELEKNLKIDTKTEEGRRILQKEQDERIKASQKGEERVFDAKTGEYKNIAVEGAKTTAALIQSQNRVADTEALLYQELGALNKKIGSSAFINDIIKSTANIQIGADGKKTTGMDRGGILNSEGATNVIKNLVDGNYKEVIKSLGTAGKEVITNLGGAAQSILTGLKDMFTAVGDSVNSKTGVPGRAGGTLAETGSVTEPKDAIVKIHKGETVFSPEATQNLTNQLQKELEKTYLSTNFVTGAYQPKKPEVDTQAEKDKLNQPKKSEVDLQIEKDKLNPQNTNNIKTETMKFPPELQKLYDLMANGGVLDQIGMDKLRSFGELGGKAFEQANIKLARQQEMQETQDREDLEMGQQMQKLKADAEQKKAEAKKQAEAAPPGEASYTPTTKPTEELPTRTGAITLDEVNRQLEMLNKSMGQLVTYTHDLVDHTDRQARYTKRLNPDLNSR